MILTVNSDFELWVMWIEAEGRKGQRKYKMDCDSEEYSQMMRDIVITNVDEMITIHVVTDFKDKRKTFKTLLETVQKKHRQLSRPADLQQAIRDVHLCVPSDAFPVARELKRLAQYVNGDKEFLVHHFIESIKDYDFKLLVQQLVVTSNRQMVIDELADFLSQMPPKPTSTSASASVEKSSSIWEKRKCYNCGKMGHGARFCRSTKRECAKCKRQGHMVEFCFQKN